MFFIIGIVAIFISGESVVAWTDREGFYEETEDHRKFRIKTGTISGIIGVLYIAIKFVVYYFHS